MKVDNRGAIAPKVLLLLLNKSLCNDVYNRVSQNATFFHEPVHMMGEVIRK